MKTNRISDVMWYTHPAKRWLDSLPIGNGNIGGMVYGDVAKDIISLGDCTMWSGCDDYNIDRVVAKEDLQEMREAIFAENHERMEQINGSKIRVECYGKPSPPTYGTHMPVGLVTIKNHDNDDVQDYYRELDMSKGVVSVSYKKDGYNYTREYFASNPDQVLLMKIKTDCPQGLNCEVGFENKSLDLVFAGDKNEMTVNTRALELKHTDGSCGVKAEIILNVQADNGDVCYKDNHILVNGSSEVTLYCTVNTDFDDLDYKAENRKVIDSAKAKGYSDIYEGSVSDINSLMGRMSLVIGDEEQDEIPTDVRIKNFQEDKQDSVIVSKFLQLARYLLVIGSRPNSRLPLCLQGNWGDDIANNMPWADDHHIDINTQQNYWHTQTANLAECNIPLFGFIDRMVKHGKVTAKATYGIEKGWCSHITLNGWGCSPQNHGGCATSGLWLISHMWEHYLYTGDKEFLKDRAYPVLKEAAEFILEFLIEDPHTGYLVTNPGYSPENGFVNPRTGGRVTMTYGPTGDTVLISELFDSIYESSKILGIDEEFAQELQKVKKRLPPFKVGSKGQLLEWIKEYEEYEPGHRHTQHLLSIYPYSTITKEKTPELFAAARKTVSRRLETLFDTEWTRGNMMNFFARFKEGSEAYDQLRWQFKSWVISDNMFTTSHNEEPPFVLDGNTSCTAGLIEMVMQSHDNVIQILPAVCEEIKTGKTTGLCARNGFELSFDWSDCKLNNLEIKSVLGNTLTVKIDAKEVICDGQKIDFTSENGNVSFGTQVGKVYKFVF